MQLSIVFLTTVVLLGSQPTLLLHDPLDGFDTIEANQGSAVGVTFVPGKAGNAALIEGSIDYPYENRFHRNEGTIQFLVRPDDFGSMGLLEVGQLGYANSIGIFRFNSLGRQITAMEVRTNAGSALQAWHDEDEARLENGRWHLVTAVWAANQAPHDFFQLYVDEVPGYRHTGSVCTPLLEPAAKHIRLGSTGWYGDGRGSYDELQIYNYAKSPEDVAQDYMTYFGPPPTEPDALAWLSRNQSFLTGLVTSQVGFPEQRAFTYDQALAAITFIHAGRLSEAQRILDRMASLQSSEGYWRDAYLASDASVFEPNVGTGPNAWMVIAANYYASHTANDRYRDMAEKAIAWLETRIDTNPASGSYGALNLGVNSPAIPNAEELYSTEHQFDAYAAFRGRAILERDEATRQRLRAEADAIVAYLMREVWNGDHFQRGFNDPERWLDCQTLAPLALGARGPDGHEFMAAVNYAYENMGRTLDYDSLAPDVDGFSYNPDWDTIWIEGTLQAALAYVLFGSVDSGEHYRREMARTVRNDGGLSYSFDESGSGEGNWPLNLRYSSLSSVAWYYFSKVRFNPLYTQGDEYTGHPVYRFWSPVKKRHFYTISAAEKQKLINYFSHVWTYEQIAYYALPTNSDPDCRPVYRFWSPVSKAHFYTIKESEKNKLITQFSEVWQYERIAFYAYPAGLEPVGTGPVYRFWSNRLKCHFYTISVAERDKLINNFAATWAYEGVAWYAYR